MLVAINVQILTGKDQVDCAEQAQGYVRDD
jgi:hypothetical protein